MSYYFDLYYAPPGNPAREASITAQVIAVGGWLYSKEPATALAGVELTFEFEDWDKAQAVHDALPQ